MNHLTFLDKIGILDPEGLKLNPLTNEKYTKPISEKYTESYRELAKTWSKFPVYAKCQEILKSISDNQVTFIVSGTGSGKTVIVPKLALHYTAYNGKVVVTLPKRQVTLASAEFAAATLDVKLGEQVGYIYKGADRSMSNANNRLVYMTDGSLFVKFVSDPTLSEYSVIVIDEAHERRIQIDLLLLFLKKLLESKVRPDLRVIIMSATIDSDKYQNYFQSVSSQVIKVSGLPNHPIEVIFQNQPVENYLRSGMQIISEILKRDPDNPQSDLLFFITTSNEAFQLCNEINVQYPWVFCVEVFSDMDTNLRVFATSLDKYHEKGDYTKKLVMATNVAESSLTINGLKYVIDSGYELRGRYDPETQAHILEKNIITKAQALQRRGRVGRTQPGICYHLMTEQQFKSLDPYPLPDILKQDITIELLGVMLYTKGQSFGEGSLMMAELMDPPTRTQFRVSKDLLELYALIDNEGVITKTGRIVQHFSSLSLNRSLFLIYSYQLHCAREASIILGMMEAIKGKMSTLMYQKPESKSAPRLSPAFIDSRGDHLTLLNIFEKWKASSNQKEWANKYQFRHNVLIKASDEMRKFYHKILNISQNREREKEPVQSGGLTDSRESVRKRLLNALKMSHHHCTARNFESIYPERKVEAQISRDSALLVKYKRHDLAKKRLIYDELTQITGNWEFNLVTIIS